jgi:hypothetical protein
MSTMDEQWKNLKPPKPRTSFDEATRIAGTLGCITVDKTSDHSGIAFFKDKAASDVFIDYCHEQGGSAYWNKEYLHAARGEWWIVFEME